MGGEREPGGEVGGDSGVGDPGLAPQFGTVGEPDGVDMAITSAAMVALVPVLAGRMGVGLDRQPKDKR